MSPAKMRILDFPIPPMCVGNHALRVARLPGHKVLDCSQICESLLESACPNTILRKRRNRRYRCSFGLSVINTRRPTSAVMDSLGDCCVRVFLGSLRTVSSGI